MLGAVGVIGVIVGVAAHDHVAERIGGCVSRLLVRMPTLLFGKMGCLTLLLHLVQQRIIVRANLAAQGPGSRDLVVSGLKVRIELVRYLLQNLPNTAAPIAGFRVPK